MASETLGAHLRNLLSVYKTLIELNKDDIKLEEYAKTKSFKKRLDNNLQELIDFSYSDKMENNLWRKEGE